MTFMGISVEIVNKKESTQIPLTLPFMISLTSFWQFPNY